MEDIRISAIVCMCGLILYQIIYKEKNKKIIYYLIFFSLGVCLSYNHNNNFKEIFKQNIENRTSVRGVIERIEYKENSIAMWLKKCSINGNDKINILVYYPLDKKDDIEELDIGYEVDIKGEIKKFEKATNKGVFDEYNYYTKQLGYHYKMYGDCLENCIKRNEIIYTLKRSLNRLSIKLQENIDILYKKDKSSIIKAMLLGEKSMLDEDIKNLYSAAGISHILAISGLHITLIGMTLYNILLKAKMNQYIVSIVTSGVVCLYGMMTHFSVSTNRAVVMLLFMLLSKFFKRSYDVLNSCCMSLIFILVQNPFMINNCGLQLSYLAVISIMVVSPTLFNLVDKKSLRRNSIKLFIEEKTGFINDYRYILSISDFIYKIFEWFKKSIIGGLSVYIVTLPVIMNNFYEIKMLSTLINVFIIPTVGILLPVIIISVLISCVSVDMGYLGAGGVDLLLELYEKVGKMCGNIKFNNVIIGYKGIGFTCFYYAVLVCVVLFMKNKSQFINVSDNSKIYEKQKEYIKYVYVIAVICFLIFLGITNNKKLEITMLDVGQGDCSCVITPKGKVIILDCGSSDVKDLYQYRIEGFLKYKGIKSVDYVFLSHLDDDHISGIIELLKLKNNKISIKNLVITKKNMLDDKYKSLVKLARKRGVNVVAFKGGNKIIVDNVVLRCLYPTESEIKEITDENESSMVLHIKYKEFDALYTGDISKVGEERLIEKTEVGEGKIDVLKVPHHGSRNSSGDIFVGKIKPTIALFSAGINNNYGHPHKEVVKKYIKNGSIVYNTIEDGAVEIITNGHTIIHKKYND